MTTKKLDRLAVATIFDINAPIWNGGSKKVGLNLRRVTKHNEIRFTYRRKSDGQLSLPDTYYFDGDLLHSIDYQKQNIKGTTLVLVPFSNLELLERI